jgi:hypothetical protein
MILRASVRHTNGTSLSASLYHFYVYVENQGFFIKILKNDQNLIFPKSSCFNAKYNFLYIIMFV